MENNKTDAAEAKYYDNTTFIDSELQANYRRMGGSINIKNEEIDGAEILEGVYAHEICIGRQSTTINPLHLACKCGCETKKLLDAELDVEEEDWLLDWYEEGEELKEKYGRAEPKSIPKFKKEEALDYRKQLKKASAVEYVKKFTEKVEKEDRIFKRLDDYMN